MKRIDFLKSLGFSTIAIATGESFLSSCMHMDVSPDISSVGDFITILKIPSEYALSSVLKAQTSQDTLLSKSKVNVLGYGENGLLGPTIKAQKGQYISLPFQNNLAEDTNIHWHGLVIPAEMDGHPDHMIKPNANFDFQFSVNQPAGLNWYHPHMHQHTGEQVTKGLSGLFIVESREEKALNLPRGSHEIPLIIQDKRFNTDGTIRHNPSRMEVMSGYLGDHVLVNGTNKPFVEVATGFYRFRVLNGSSARIYNLALSNNADFYLIGSDGGILPQVETLKSLMFAPAERADILIDFSNLKVGEKIYLKSEKFNGMGNSQGTQTFDILSFNVIKTETDTFKMPSVLLPLDKLSAASKTRQFKLTMGMMAMGGGMNKINGKTFEASRIDETVNLGNTEIWEFDNSTGNEPHPMHIHGVQFQVKSRSGGRNSIMAQEKGWKDTVLVAPNEKVKVQMTFTQKGKFLVHCHNLEHEDDGMMLNFEVN